MRLTASLRLRIAKAGLAKSHEAGERRAEVERAERSGRLETAKDTVAACVALSQAFVGDPEESEAVGEVLFERLEREDEDLMLDAPITQVVERICNDLGLDAPWAVRWIKTEPGDEDADDDPDHDDLRPEPFGPPGPPGDTWPDALELRRTSGP